MRRQEPSVPVKATATLSGHNGISRPGAIQGGHFKLDPVQNDRA